MFFATTQVQQENALRRPARKGLTIVEVLAATLLAALLMSAVLGVLKAVTGHQKLFTQGLPESWQPRLCSLLEWDLTNSKTVLVNADGFELRGYAGRDFTSGMPLHCRTTVEYAVKKVRGESCLVRTETHVDASNLDNAQSELVLNRIEGIVLGDAGSTAPSVQKREASEEGDPLPEQVAVAITAADSHDEVFRHVFVLH